MAGVVVDLHKPGQLGGIRIRQHTDYANKVGAGIDHFCVMANLFKTQSFEIVGADGTRDDFSYKHCITPKRLTAAGRGPH
jgi:Protein of unknown function (DUF3223)